MTMYEFGSVSSSAYDIDGFISRLNAKSADGWDVMTVVSAGADLVGVLRRDASAPVAEVARVADIAPVVVAAPVVEAISVVEPVAYVPEPAPIYVPEPVVVAPVIETPSYTDFTTTAVAPAVSVEPSGWGSMPEVAAVAPVVIPVAPAPEPEPVATSTTPSGWYPDPSGRFEMRYWDGMAWTEHVSRQGQQYTDPPVA